MAQMEKKFQKLVAIEPVSLIPSAQEELKQYADHHRQQPYHFH